MNALITDVSFYEDDAETPRHIDFVKMKSAGVSGTFIRAGQRNWVDSSFVRSWKDSKLAGMPRGAYWFFDPRENPKQQAQLCANVIGIDDGELPLFADFEALTGVANASGEMLMSFMEELKRLMPEKELGIYTGYWHWKDNVPTSLHGYFMQYQLWIAAYNSVGPSLPAPWSRWHFWQFSDTGDGKLYGTEGAVDLNQFNGSVSDFKNRYKIQDVPIVVQPSSDQIIETHEGVKLHIIERFSAKCFVHVIDTGLARIEVSDCGYRTPKYALDKYGAQIVSNGGGWPDKQDSTHRSNEMWVANGKYMQQPQYIKDNRPYINVSDLGGVSVSPDAKIIANIYNAVGFDRILLWGGAFNNAITDRTTKDARTASGVTGDGKFVLLSVEGNDIFNHGLTFLEMANVMLECGVINAGNNDGGSSSSIRNSAISDESLFVGSDGAEAPVINHIMVFAKPINTEPPTGEDKMNYKVLLGTSVRPTPSMYNTAVGTVIKGETFQSIEVVTGTNLLKPADFGVTFIKHPKGWLPMVYKSVIYVEEVFDVEPSIITRILEIDTDNGKVRIDGGAWL
jgi:lysozyme